jgi:tellurite resistance protein TehA-like permease
MGTGAVSLALSVQFATWEAGWLLWSARLFLVMATVLAVVLLPRYLRRFRDRVALVSEIGDPAHGAMLATLPAGLLILATAWGRVGWQPVGLWVDAALLVVGVGVATGLGLWWSASMLRGQQGLEGVNGGWLIPPVMNLIVPLALAPLIAEYPGAGLPLLGFMFYGVGVVLFVAMLTLLIARLALRPPLPAAMAPSMWIPLAPAGVMGLALLQLLKATGADPAAGVIVAGMGLGFGLWWAAFAWLELRRAKPPLHPGWWGFVFPVAAMTLSWGNVALVSGVLGLEVLGALATAVLIGLWATVAVRTVRLG